MLIRETGKPDPKAGSENQSAVKRAVAIAYGATGTCDYCQGTGRVRSVKQVDRRGEKVKGRYPKEGCQALRAARVLASVTSTRSAHLPDATAVTAQD